MTKFTAMGGYSNLLMCRHSFLIYLFLLVIIVRPNGLLFSN